MKMSVALPTRHGFIRASEVVVAGVEDAVAGPEEHVDGLGRRRRLELTPDRLQTVGPQPAGAEEARKFKNCNLEQ